MFVSSWRALWRAAGLLMVVVALLAMSWLTLVSLAKSYETFCRIRESQGETAVRVVDIDVLGRQVTREFISDGMLC